MYCKKCGKEIDDAAQFCPSCGAPANGSKDNTVTQTKEKKKKRHPVLGAFLAIIGILIIIGAVSGGGDKPEKVSENSTIQAAQPTEPESFTVGDTVSLNDINVTLVSVTESEGANYSVPSDGKVFLICEFEIENKSGNDIAVSSMMSFEAYVDDYSSTLSLGAIMASDKTQLDGSVASGKKMAGIVGYEADKNWKEFEIRFAPSVWSGKEIIFTYSK